MSAEIDFQPAIDVITREFYKVAGELFGDYAFELLDKLGMLDYNDERIKEVKKQLDAVKFFGELFHMTPSQMTAEKEAKFKNLCLTAALLKDIANKKVKIIKAKGGRDNG